MKVGEIWKPIGRNKEILDGGKIEILEIQTGTIAPMTNEKYNPNAEWIAFKYLDTNFKTGSTKEYVLKYYEKDYDASR